MTLENAGRPPPLGALRELRYSAGEGVVHRVPRGPEDRLGYAVFAGSRTEVAAALAALDEGVEVYRGD